MTGRQTEVQQYVDRINIACDQIISWVFKRGGLSQFPRVIEYLAKENGGAGWEDSYQNFLIAQLCSSKWLIKDETQNDLYRCTLDASYWRRSSEEWRMNAYKQQLTHISMDMEPNREQILGATFESHPVFFSTDFFRTTGFSPENAKEIDLQYFIRYLTELADGKSLSLSNQVSASREDTRRKSMWDRIVFLLGMKTK